MAWAAAPLHLPGRHSPRIVPRVFDAPGFPWAHEAWETATASGVLNHMPQARVQRWAEIYHEVGIARDRVAGLGEQLDGLGPLAFDRRLAPAEKAAYLERLGHLETVLSAISNISRQFIRSAHVIGVDPPAEKVKARLDELRAAYGPCTADVKLPLS